MIDLARKAAAEVLFRHGLPVSAQDALEGIVDGGIEVQVALAAICMARQEGEMKGTAMNSYEFTIVAGGLPIEGDDWHDSFHEAGCDDALLSLQRGLFVLQFDREADSLAEAVASACEDVRRNHRAHHAGHPPSRQGGPSDAA